MWLTDLAEDDILNLVTDSDKTREVNEDDPIWETIGKA